MIARTSRVRSSPRWSTRDMTVPSAGGLGAVRARPADPGMPASISASVSAISGARRRDQFVPGVGSLVGAAAAGIGAAATGTSRPRPESRGGAGDGGRGGSRSGGGRRGQWGHVDFDGVLDVGGGLAELADGLADRGAHLGQLAGSQDEERDHQDDDELEGLRC